jgi:hypothetical protein
MAAFGRLSLPELPYFLIIICQNFSLFNSFHGDRSGRPMLLEVWTCRRCISVRQIALAQRMLRKLEENIFRIAGVKSTQSLTTGTASSPCKGK